MIQAHRFLSFDTIKNPARDEVLPSEDSGSTGVRHFQARNVVFSTNLAFKGSMRMLVEILSIQSLSEILWISEEVVAETTALIVHRDTATAESSVARE